MLKCSDCGWDLTRTSQETCTIETDMHQTGETVGLCEHYMRKHIERAGGAGQWLVAVKADHRVMVGSRP
jgi:hypothetical protein